MAVKRGMAAAVGLEVLAAAAAAAPPVPTISVGPAAAEYLRSAAFEFSSAGADSFQCKLDTDAWAACTSPHYVMPNAANKFAVLTAASHTWAVKACIGADCSAEASRTWEVKSVIDLAKTGDALIGTRVLKDDTPPEDYSSTSGEPGLTMFIKGITRFQCLEAILLFDDPIVYPGQVGGSHLHSIWGNRNINAHTTNEQLFTGHGDTQTSPRSACQGDDINRSGYWAPAMLAPVYDSSGTRTGWEVVRKDDDMKAIEAGLFHETFYYSAIVTDTSTIQRPPVGLRMVAGDINGHPDSTPVAAVLEDAYYVTHWYCAVRGSAAGRAGIVMNHSIPECPLTYDAKGRPNNLVHFVVRFPSCWDGVNLDSTDHRSHVAFPEYVPRTSPRQITCPTTHPVPFPEVSFHYSFAVEEKNADPDTKTSRGWRLSSDGYIVTPSTPGGHSLHGDFINAWHPEVMDAWINGCLKAGKNCHDGELGDPNGQGQSYSVGLLNSVMIPQPAPAPDIGNSDYGGMTAPTYNQGGGATTTTATTTETVPEIGGMIATTTTTTTATVVNSTNTSQTVSSLAGQAALSALVAAVVLLQS